MKNPALISAVKSAAFFFFFACAYAYACPRANAEDWGGSTVGCVITNSGESVTYGPDNMPESGDLVIVFTGGCTVNFSQDVLVRGFLLVGGGGSGGYSASSTNTKGAGGGGGAGAMHVIDNGEGSDKLAAAAYSVIVGAGGESVSYGLSCGTNGQESAIKLDGDYVLRQGVKLKAPGGGGGGVNSQAGLSGGCGGGGSASSDTSNSAGGGVDQFVSDNANVYGCAGGNGGVKTGDVTKVGRGAAAGGGGAGEAGDQPLCATTTDQAGNGGNGKESTITGQSVYYAGGGGGGHQINVSYKGRGGLGGGGDGGCKKDGLTNGGAAKPGVDGLGGGGGGQGHTSGASGKGGSGVVILRISGFKAGATKVFEDDLNDFDPPGKVTAYTGEEIIGVKESMNWVVKSGVTNATDAGTYSAVVSVADCGNVWDDDTQDDRTYTWSITQSVNYVTTPLSMGSYRCTSTPVAPAFAAKFGTPVFTYYKAGVSVGNSAPTEAGDYTVGVQVPGNGNWTEIPDLPENRVEFTVYGRPHYTYRNWVDIRVDPIGKKYSGVKFRIDISETLMPGFLYSQMPAYSEGDKIAVTDGKGVDEGEEYLPARVIKWNPGGVSIVDVRIDELPTEGMTIRMYWGNRMSIEPLPDWNKSYSSNYSDGYETTSNEFCVGLVSLGTDTTGGTRENRWQVEPSMSKTSWTWGEAIADVDKGSAYEVDSSDIDVVYSNTVSSVTQAILPEHPGSYEVTFSVADLATSYTSDSFTDYRTALSKTIAFSISKATNAVTSFTMSGWLSGQAGNDPSATVQHGTPKFAYYNKDGDSLGGKPTMPGWYSVGVSVDGTDDYDGIVDDPARRIAFAIGQSPHDAFANWTEVYVPGTGLAVANAEIEIQLPDYVGSDVRATLNEAYLPQVTNGSPRTLTAKLSSLSADGATIRLYWNETGTAAECETFMAGIPTVTVSDPARFGLVSFDGVRTNRWVTLPSFSPSTWGYGSEPGTLNVGVAVEGDPAEYTVVYSNKTTNVTGAEIPTAKGEYAAIVMVPGETETNGDKRLAMFGTVDFTITKAENEITTPLTMGNWRYGNTPCVPTCGVKFGTPVYVYFDSEMHQLSAKPETAGDYYVAVTVAETEDYTGIAVTDPGARIAFSIFDSAINLFHYWVDLKIPGTGSVVNDAKVKVTIGPDICMGFDYFRLNQRELDPPLEPDFRVTDSAGEYLSMLFENWPGSGESTTWVNIPTLPADGTTIRLYWGAKGSMEEYTKITPAPSASAVRATLAADYGLVSEDGVRENRWIVKPGMTPTTWAYDENSSVEITNGVAYEIDGPIAPYFVDWTKPDVKWESLPSDYGIYKAYFVAPELTDARGTRKKLELIVQFSITTAVNEVITPLSMSGWRTGEAPKHPTFETKFGTPAYYWSSNQVDWVAWTTMNWDNLAPTQSGKYYLRAAVPPSAALNFTGVTNECEFGIYKGAAEMFRDYVDIQLIDYVGEPLTNVPVRIALWNDGNVRFQTMTEGKWGSTYPINFQYSRLREPQDAKNADIRFVVKDTADYLPQEIEKWRETVNGIKDVSYIWVRIPSLTSEGVTIRLYCSATDSEVEPVPEGIWSNYTRDQAAAVTSDVDFPFGLYVRDGVCDNQWIGKILHRESEGLHYPTLSKTMWDVGDEPADVYKGDSMEDGSLISVVYCEYPDRNPSETMPTEAGSYIARFTVPAATNTIHGITRIRNELVYEIEFYILTHLPYDALVGDGRVMLFNADFPDGADGEHAIRYQGYCVTNPEKSPYYWRNLNDDGYTSSANNLKSGTQFSYHRSSDGAKIWHLFNCRMGNTFPTSDDEDLTLHTTSCYLPWSPTSKSIMNAEMPVAKRSTVGWCVMQNYGQETEVSGYDCAAIYSPCYAEGIGTIYFDVVNCGTNSFMGTAEFYVEYATNALAYSNWAPTDDHAIYVNPETHKTNWYGNITAWKRARPHVLKRDYTPEEYAAGVGEFIDEGVPPSYSVTPMIRNTGSTNNFYRVYVPIDTTCPTRFRIRRVKQNPQHLQDRDNADALIAFDNIIVSYPAMRAKLEPYGFMDTERGGKQTIGQEGAFVDAFPSVTQTNIIARAKPTYVVNGGVTNAVSDDFIAVGRLHYRWRYLSQLWWVNGAFVEDEKTAGWSETTLDAADGFRSVRKLDLPRDNDGNYLQGDLEWWYSLILCAPFYSYYDYSGTGLGVPGYNEEHLMVTNRLTGTYLDSQGTDWFTRLRDGQSETEGMNLYVQHLVCEDTYNTNFVTEVVEMELVFDHVWRGYLRTPLPNEEIALYRLEQLNVQTSPVETFAYNTNYFYSSAHGTFPVSATLEEGTTNDWSSFTLDNKSGYALFQYDETTRALTIVHGDYQNFNRWDDANDDVFVGTSGNYDSLTAKGQSRKKRDFASNYSRYRDMPATNSFWRFSSLRDIGLHFYGHTEPYTEFAEEEENGWEIGMAQWIAKHYADGRWDRYDTTTPWKDEWSDAGVSVQLRGCGEGYLVMNGSPEECPRGLDTVSFNARLAQNREFDRFAYYSGEAIKRMTNYTFVTRSTFDTCGNSNFTGAATLSMAAYYRPSIGCYEARFEQSVGIPYPDDHSCAMGPNVTNQTFSIYRWNFERSGKITQTLLATALLSSTNGMPCPISPYPILDTNEKYMPMAISVESTPEGTRITAQVSYDGLDLTRGADELNNLGWTAISVTDVSSSRMTSGTYGVLSVNCDGIFAKPQYFAAPIGEGGFETNLVRGCDVELNDDLWEIFPGRMKYCNGWFDVTNGCHWVTNGYVYVTNYIGDIDKSFAVSRVAITNLVWELTPQYHPHVQYLCSDHRETPQKLYVYLGQANRTDWYGDPKHLFKSLDITGFGHPGRQKDYVFPLYWRGNSEALELNSDKYYAIRFETGGTVEDARVDVAVDSVELTQWLGDDYDNCGAAGYVLPYEKEYGGDTKAHTNFVFSQCWITNRSLLMSAKRTAWEKPCSVRSPLMDGTYTRGWGLGMFSFEYREATTNMNLLFQINTNVTYTSVGSCDDLDDYNWHTITNFDFSQVSTLQRKSGVMSAYLGWHGAKGVMRIVVDPKLVEASRYQTDPATFPQIRIVKAFCRDEPALDEGSWWGWNLRTYGTTDGTDPEGKMYLPDATQSIGKQGNSLCLNNSVTLNIDLKDPESYKLNEPFLQSPNFTSANVGEITFKARKFGYTDSVRDEQPALVTLYGSRSGYVVGGQAEGQWERVEDFIVSNSTFTTYTYQTQPGDDYAAFRLVVTGVPLARQTDYTPGGGLPEDGSYSGYATPVRVLIDEVLVTEAVRARMGLSNIGAFRHDLLGTDTVPNVPSEYEQPLCHEEWGVQARIYAAQLADKIDMTVHQPRVRLWWFVGTTPWGFDRWRHSPGCRSALLGRATNTNFVYRSSYLSSEAAVMDAVNDPGTVVQYMLEVEYYQNDSDRPMTNLMTSADWRKPEWYKGIDYNRDLGQNEHFSAYTILDEVAPHWAWINEVNLYGATAANDSQLDTDAQYIEIAAPIEADLDGWTVNLLKAESGSSVVKTNVLAMFGSNNLLSRKTSNSGSNMVFHVIASPSASESKKIKDSKCEIDGTWSQKVGTIDVVEPIGLQLVRSSGIIESEVVLSGYNSMADMGGILGDAYDPYNIAAQMNELLPTSKFICIGSDDCVDDGGFRGWGTSASLNVMVNYGSETNDWTNGVYCTPGTVNWGQYINPDHPTPNGQTILIYFNLSGPHIVQSVGELFLTNQTAMIAIKKGSDLGTNVTYRVDPWYELAPVTTNGTVTTDGRFLDRDESGYRWYQYTIGVHCSNSVSVYASAQLQRDIPIDDNKYHDAIEDWINKGTDIDGNPWENWKDGKIYLSDFIPLSHAFTNQMSLTEMYWLDMDPTVSNQAFVAGIVKPAMPDEMSAVELPWGGSYKGDATVTNTTMTVYLMLTNRCEDSSDTAHYGKAWTPYVLRGLAPGSSSLDYDYSSHYNWTSETFKVEGILANGLTDDTKIDYWIPLRYFVFHRDSFPQKGEPHEGESVISVLDPFSTESPGYGAGWWDWAQTHGSTPVFYRWNLDTRRQPYSVEVLAPTNLISTRVTSPEE